MRIRKWFCCVRLTGCLSPCPPDSLQVCVELKGGAVGGLGAQAPLPPPAGEAAWLKRVQQLVV